MKRTLAATLALTAFLVSPASAQVRMKGYDLPASLAAEAALEAVRVCEASGYRVSAAVVDQSGELRAFIKGDHATVHTKDTSFRKAYTIVTLGPIFGADTLGAFVEKTKTSPSVPSFLTIPNIILLPGAAAMKAGGEIVAGLGVGGAPGGDKDEICAIAGLAKIKDRLPQ